MQRTKAIGPPAARVVPFSLEAMRATPDWQAAMAWPIRPTVLRPLIKRQACDLLALLGELPTGDVRDTALLAGPLILSRAGMLLVAALCTQAEPEAGIHLVGGPPEFDYLRGLSDAADPLPVARIAAGPPGGKARLPALRRIARTLSWMPFWRLPAALVAPSALAVSHNHLLRQVAADRGERLGFDHANLLLDRARKAAGPVAPVIEVAPLARRIAGILAEQPGLDPVRRARLVRLIEAAAEQLLTRAATDLAVLGRWRRPPRTLWSGTGGYYPARALGLEVLRRGGTVTRFAHGGSAGMTDAIEPLALGELAVSTRFVVDTPERAANIIALGGLDLVSGFSDVEVVGHTSDLAFAAPVEPAPRRAGTPPRVLYVSTAFLGFRIGHPPFLPDTVYLDWQLRLAGRLLEMPLDLLCQPHPEGELYGRRHPLADVAPTSTRLFEEVMDEADIFLFDWPHSTTFWVALCTDRPVVYVDFGLTGFVPRVRELIERRCRVVPAVYDANNLPQVDTAALERAILDGPAHADGSPFRRLLGGQD